MYSILVPLLLLAPGTQYTVVGWYSIFKAVYLQDK